MSHPFFTVGHSNRSLEAFATLLKKAAVDVVVDIRTVPRSRANPQFNHDTLPDALAAFGITYEHIPELGGLRNKSKTIPRADNSFWENDSFHNYADYALSDGFHHGLDKLIEKGHDRRCAIMCSEAVWWRCHRRIVADYLMARGEHVYHIMGPGRLDLAQITPGAAIQADGVVTYPSE